MGENCSADFHCHNFGPVSFHVLIYKMITIIIEGKSGDDGMMWDLQFLIHRGICAWHRAGKPEINGSWSEIKIFSRGVQARRQSLTVPRGNTVFVLVDVAAYLCIRKLVLSDVPASVV